MTICKYCNEDKEDDDFAWKNKRLGTRNKKCKFCQREYAKLHYNNNKKYYFKKAKKHDALFQIWYKDYMSDKKCVNCGESHWATLDWHHIDPDTKEGNVGTFRKNCSKIKVLNEISKCICLCSNCHRILHYG